MLLPVPTTTAAVVQFIADVGVWGTPFFSEFWEWGYMVLGFAIVCYIFYGTMSKLWEYVTDKDDDDKDKKLINTDPIDRQLKINRVKEIDTKIDLNILRQQELRRKVSGGFKEVRWDFIGGKRHYY